MGGKKGRYIMDNSKKIAVGIIGCGNISEIYLKNLSGVMQHAKVVACADLIFERAQAKANEFGLIALTYDEILADKDIEIILNLTIPKAHAQVCIDAINAGKSVYVEKPFASTISEGKKILELAKLKGVLVGGAPDTFLGAGIQTCKKLIEAGEIGKPVAASANMLCHGHESWHPNPEFYYQFGGGPMFDMGPYYLTALVELLGSINRVSGSAQISFPQRTKTTEVNFGEKIDVEVPTHISGVMDFESGAIGTISTSFDVWSHNLPCIEIYGSEGTISVPDPNTFSGPVKVKRFDEENWREIDVTLPYSENSRGLGVDGMAEALLTGREHKANGKLAFHVLEVMHGFYSSSETSAHINIESRV